MNRIHPVAFFFLTALLTWIGFRVFGFFGFLAILGLALLVRYLITERPDLTDGARRSVSKALAGGSKQTRHEGATARSSTYPDGAPLDDREQTQFNDLVGTFRSAPTADTEGRRARRHTSSDDTPQSTAFFGGAFSGGSATPHSGGSGHCSPSDGGSSSSSDSGSSSSSSDGGGGGGGCD